MYYSLWDSVGISILRIAIIAFATGFGFAIGWFFSPQAKPLRKMALILFALVFVACAIFLNNFIGWNAAILLAFGGFVAGIWYWLGQWPSGLLSAPTTFGSSRWAQAEDVAEKDLYGTDGIRIGQFPNANGQMEWVSYKGDRHLMTIAPTRSGKGTTQIVPNLLTYAGSALVIDPKGENAAITAEQRYHMGQEIHIVDPWGITPL